MRRPLDVAIATVAGMVCHVGFLAAIGTMAWSLVSGMQNGFGRLPAPWDALADFALLVQFPLLHSFLLAKPGRRLLTRLAPRGHGRTLATTSFATIASLQLLLVFLAWTPSGVCWHPPVAAAVVAGAAFVAAWLFLVRAICDAGASVQTGALGWWSLLRERAPVYGPLPTTGLFRVCRQPIYLGFLLVLWTAPAWSPDHLALALAWTPYCILAPVWKERRLAAAYGAAFEDYRRAVPYFLPRLLPRDRR